MSLSKVCCFLGKRRVLPSHLFRFDSVSCLPKRTSLVFFTIIKKNFLAIFDVSELHFDPAILDMSSANVTGGVRTAAGLLRARRRVTMR